MAYKFLICLITLLFPFFGYTMELCIQCHTDKLHYVSRGACTLCHLGDGNTSRIDLAHNNILTSNYAFFLMKDSWQVFKGNYLIKHAACMRCHIIGDAGNILAANLNISAREKDIKTLNEAIRNPSIYMPQFNFSDKHITYIINTLLNHAFYRKKIEELGYLIVHFDRNVEEKNIFDENCGKCHKIILKEKGTLGEANRGPNLSGLFTDEFSSIREVKKWDEKKLKKWIRNPRDIKKNALMPPISLKENEITDVVELFK